MSAEESQHFVKCFIVWLKNQITQRNFSTDVVESIEVATQCLEAAYEISSGEEGSAGDASAGPKYADVDLFQMFQSACVNVSADRKEQAEEIKNDGNRLMKESKFNEALFAYNKAISLDATNSTFYCNRAAAYIRLSEYDKAISDCKLALVYNPNYGKAYGRMGIAYSNLRKYEEACAAYRKAIELEPNNEDYKSKLRMTESQMENLGQQLFNQITGSNVDFRNLIMDMLSDPQMSMASCEAASRVASQFPDILNEFRSQLGFFMNRNPSASNQPPQQQSQQQSQPEQQPLGDSTTGPSLSSENMPGQEQPPPSDQNSDNTNG